MKICVHITFYVKDDLENKLKNLSKIYNSFFSISKNVNIFIHTNRKIKNFKKNLFFIYHDIRKEDPYKLTWKCRPMMKSQIGKYDYFIYSEDDNLFNKKNFNYWLKYQKIFKKKNIMLGLLELKDRHLIILCGALITLSNSANMFW